MVAAVQPQAGRQLRGPPHVILQDGGGVVTSAGGQFLGDPHFDRLPESVLGDGGEVDDAAAAVAQDRGLPDVFALLLFRGDPRAADRLLQIVRQRPLVSRKPGCLNGEDRGRVGGEQQAAEDPQLVKVGQPRTRQARNPSSG